MKVTIYNRKQIETINYVDEPHFIISIYTPGDNPPILQTNLNTKGSLQLAFDDLASIPSIDMQEYFKDMYNREYVLFNTEQADLIARIVITQVQEGIEHFLIHCDAGISRSRGVGRAILQWSRENDSWLFKTGHPNVWVYQLVFWELDKLQPLGPKK